MWGVNIIRISIEKASRQLLSDRPEIDSTFALFAGVLGNKLDLIYNQVSP
jgi:hypothetical protein